MKSGCLVQLRKRPPWSEDGRGLLLELRAITEEGRQLEGKRREKEGESVVSLGGTTSGCYKLIEWRQALLSMRSQPPIDAACYLVSPGDFFKLTPLY
ncbi:hypothetical protein GOP47_0009402 [Adiantum capillus-veneris]|uniref:Uncharacterized protein n=1 Tax=Adiantum capillus-veneris TaxID=13818 RepID=A0A9D4ZJH2_ADICA|nr:hypothetical protein GOP47_0009402 [Adiantum capillus-veneris]